MWRINLGRHKNGSLVFIAQPFNILPDIIAGLGVQANRGFIQEKQAGAVEQSPHDFQPAAHPTGVSLDQAVFM